MCVSGVIIHKNLTSFPPSSAKNVDNASPANIQRGRLDMWSQLEPTLLGVGVRYGIKHDYHLLKYFPWL